MNEYKLRKDYQNINKSIIDKIANIVENGSIANPKHKDAINEFMKTVDYDYCNSVCEFIASIFNVNRDDLLMHAGLIGTPYIFHLREHTEKLLLYQA